MKRFFLTLFSFFVLSNIALSQDKLNSGGMLSLGTRTTISAFNDDKNEFPGIGVGGQFRLRLSEKINTDWFFDYITSDILTYAHRTDYHIGWSVLYYPFATKPTLNQDQVNSKFKSFFRPYILAGHCFDYSLFQDKNDGDHFAERWSSAVQAGLGCHFNMSPRFDVSLTTQYMVHLGKHIDVDYDFNSNTLLFGEHKSSALAGHLLVNLSLNYKIAKLWGRK